MPADWRANTVEALKANFSNCKYFKVTTREYRLPSTPRPFVLFNLRIVGPDDAVYSRDRALWEYLPRGCTYVYDHDGVLLASVQGTRKFGYLEDSSRLPFGNVEAVTCFRAMRKENGENAQVTAFVYDNVRYWLGGSKNVHMIFRDGGDIECAEYAAEQFVYARRIARLVVDGCPSAFAQWLAESKQTAVGEAILSSSEHFVDYGAVGDHIRFFALTSLQCGSGRLTCMLPVQAFSRFKEFGLHVTYLSAEVEFPSPAADRLLSDIMHESNSEGAVLYCTSGSDRLEGSQVVYMAKVKCISYVLERVIRECTFRRSDPFHITQKVQSTAASVFQNETEALAVKDWIKSRLDFLISFSGWVQNSDRCKQMSNDDIQHIWVSLQREFSSLPRQDWWASATPHTNTRFIATRGIPCSGKSSIMRALKILMDDTGHYAIWLNQDEAGNKNAYLRAVKQAKEENPQFILLDKSNISLQNLTDITAIIDGPLDAILDFVHPLDEPSCYKHASVLCKQRFLARQDAHRSLRSDVDIDMVLGAMSSLSVGLNKSARLASARFPIDITASKTEMLSQAYSSLFPDSERPSTAALESALSFSQQYEDLLRDEKWRVRYFGLFPKEESLIDKLRSDLPESTTSGMKAIQQPHITLSYQGDHISPREYVILSKLLNSKYTVRITAVQWDDKVCAAVATLPDEIKSFKSTPHITLAIVSGVRPFYANVMLQKSDQETSRINLEKPLEIEMDLLAERVPIRKNEPKPEPPLSMKQVKRPVKIASDIGGVIYKTRLEKYGEHIIDDEVTEVVDSFESLRLLKQAGYDVHLLSYCGQATEMRTREKLLRQNMQEIVPEQKWIFCRARTDKFRIMLDRGIECLVDDNKEIIESCRKNGLKAVHFGGEAQTWKVALKRIDQIKW